LGADVLAESKWAGATVRGGSLQVEAFVCPITQDLMADPVVTADGHTYEREAILRWLHKQQSCGLPCTSPLTGEPLEHINLVPNVALRGLIRELLGSSASHGYVHGN